MAIGTVLIVEDEQQLRRALGHAFTNADFRVLEASNGKVGLGIALAQHPDAILLDIQMPVMDGLTVMEKVRQDAWGRQVPLILLTNVSIDSDKIMAAVSKDEPAYFLIKSDWSLDGIVGKVKEAISAHQASAATE